LYSLYSFKNLSSPLISFILPWIENKSQASTPSLQSLSFDDFGRNMKISKTKHEVTQKKHEPTRKKHEAIQKSEQGGALLFYQKEEEAEKRRKFVKTNKEDSYKD
ncbi:hypothetical protein LINPERHAP1_LOCUS5129, partial [Linum perenne]